MKRDRLYTANKHNKTQFARDIDRTHQNVFDGLFSSTLQRPTVAPRYNTSIGRAMYSSLTSQNLKMETPKAPNGTLSNYFNQDAGAFWNNAGAGNGSGGQDQGFGNGASGNLAWASAAPGMGEGVTAAMNNQYSSAAGNGFSFVDTQLAGGKRHKAGMAGVNTGAAMMNAGLQSGNASMILAGGIAGTAGTIVNHLFGSKINEDNVKAVEDNIDNMNRTANLLSSVRDNASFRQAMDNVDMGFDFTQDYIGKDGMFGSEAKDTYNDLFFKQFFSRENLKHGIAQAAKNINKTNDSMIRRNSAAYGGPLEQLGSNNIGAIGYGFMSDYLNTKQRNADNRNQMTNMFMGTPNSMFAFGGDLGTHGADFSTGLVHIDVGGSHSENPNEGVQMGVDPEGTPNLVEEKETVYNNYVFSNRILADEATKKLFHLPKKKDITFADISKKLEKEIQERPNDPISNAGFKAQMQTLEEQQERQKQEMEAERAKAAFEALSPEEQVAVMQQAAQQEAAMQEAMAQEAAIGQSNGHPLGQSSPEEVAMMEQQADGTDANAGEAPVMAEGGNLFVKGGQKINPYEYSKKWDGFDYFDPATNTYDEGYLRFAQGINQDWVDRILKGQYGSMNRYYAKNNGIAPTPAQVAALATDKKYSDMHKAMAAAYKEYLAGIDPKTGKPIVPATEEAPAKKEEEVQTPKEEATAPAKVTETPEATIEEAIAETQIPRQRYEGLRYSGLFGPVAGLGMMAAGLGKPDYSYMDAALKDAGKVTLASYKPLGNYLRYRPMDVWYEQNRMDANARATDRAIANNTAPIGTRMAGLLASGYNNLIADGELYRKALEYNDEKNRQIADFNRGTDQYNSDAFSRTSQFNAEAINRANQFRSQLALQAAQERLDRDASWYNSLYGNVAGLFKGMSDLGRENALWNMISRTAADTTNLGDSNTAGIYLSNKKKKSQGGKVRRKRGLTY